MEYTRDELTDMTAGDIRIIAEGLGIEYTTKVPTIDAIMAYQQAKEPNLLNLQESEPVKVVEAPKPVEPVKPVELLEQVNKVQTYYERIGIPVGNDGDKIRYRLDGSRIN